MSALAKTRWVTWFGFNKTGISTFASSFNKPYMTHLGKPWLFLII
jgi:hypothetical protein